MEIANRPQVDAEAGTLMAQIMERHRVELIRLLGNPPDYDRVPLAFWQKIRREYEQEVAAILLLVFLQSTQRHGYLGGSDDTLQRTQALLWAGQRARDVATQVTLTTMERLDNASTRWQEKMQSGLATADDIIEEAGETLDSLLGPDRAEAIAEDQVTTAQSVGGEWAIENTVGKSVADTWFTERDDRVCPICSPLHGAVRATWSAQFPKGPPAHRRCRCWIKYDNLRDQG